MTDDFESKAREAANEIYANFMVSARDYDKAIDYGFAMAMWAREQMQAENKVWKNLDAVSNKQIFILQNKLDQADVNIKELKSQLELRLNDKNCAHVIAFEDHLELKAECKKLKAQVKAWAEKWTTQNDQSGTFRLWQEKDNEIERLKAALEQAKGEKNDFMAGVMNFRCSVCKQVAGPLYPVNLMTEIKSLEVLAENDSAKLAKFEGLLGEALTIIQDYVSGFTVWIDEARAALKGDVE